MHSFNVEYPFEISILSRPGRSVGSGIQVPHNAVGSELAAEFGRTVARFSISAIRI
jgi:hypothetical protein